jgi:hypothetical protein
VAARLQHFNTSTLWAQQVPRAIPFLASSTKASVSLGTPTTVSFVLFFLLGWSNPQNAAVQPLSACGSQATKARYVTVRQCRCLSFRTPVYPSVCVCVYYTREPKSELFSLSSSSSFIFVRNGRSVCSVLFCSFSCNPLGGVGWLGLGLGILGRKMEGRAMEVIFFLLGPSGWDIHMGTRELRDGKRDGWTGI